MKKVIFVTPIKSASGKISSDSDTYLRTNPVTGKSHTGRLQHPYKGPASEKQAACRNRFRAVMALVTERLRDPEIHAEMTREFWSQNEIGTLIGYAYNKWKGEVL